MTWQRARQPDQKQERVAHILQVAGELFDQKDVSEISMREIAENAGLGKASLYHYFKTKEELFLSVYKYETEAWLVEVEKRLGRLRSPTPQRVAKVLASVLKEHDRMCGLSVIFLSVLEKNVTAEFITEFKRSMLHLSLQFLGQLQSCLPNLSQQATSDFLFQHHALIAGLWPLANPAPVVEKVMQREEFKVFRIDFYKVIERSFVQLLSNGATP